jgi:hexosaminidase
MSPTKYSYFDYYQSLDHGTEPPAFGGFIPLEKVYSFEPIPDRPAPQFQPRILGAQANLWTERIASLSYAEYMTFPRLSALAEVLWSPQAARDWNDFSRRLETHEFRLNQLDVNYRRDLSVKIGEWTPSQLTTNAAGTNLEWNVTSEMKGAGQYCVTFEHTEGSGLVINSVSLLRDGVQVAKDGHMGFAARHPTNPVYILDLPKSPNANYILRASVSGADSHGAVSWVFKPAGKME